MQKSIFLLLFTAVVFSSCIEEPEYTNEPRISVVRAVNQPANRGDSIAVVISFQDGDGDLGLEASDLEPDYGQYLIDEVGNLVVDSNGDTVQNPFHHNMFIDILKKEGSNFTEVEFGFPFYSRFPPLNTLGNQTALEGEMSQSFLLILGFGSEPVLRQGDTVKLQVQIADRAKNLSNVAETEEFVLGQ